MRIHELFEQTTTAPTVTTQLSTLKRQAEQQRAAGNEEGARASERAMAQLSQQSKTVAPPAATTTPAADPKLLAAIRDVESGGRADAVSRAGAVGTMQTMPKTLRDPGYGVRPAADNSPEELERVGRDYFSALMKKYGGDAPTAAAAYNMGPGALDRWIAAGADMTKLPKETQAYVPKVMNRYFDLANTWGGGKKPTQVAAANTVAPVKKA
jgi:soluble lytic murein transglycosylase-like protein